MLTEDILEVLAERLVNRIEEANAFVLKTIGNRINQIGTLSASDARRLVQTLEFGGDLDKIANKLAQITNLNVKDIFDIFEGIAKNNLEFAKPFYELKGVDYIPYEQNIALQQQVRAIARVTATQYINITGTRGFSKKGPFGRVVYSSIGQTYRDTLDKSVLAIAQGKSTFQSEMYRTIKELGQSGVRTVDYANGYSKRLDTAIRQNMLEGITALHNATQRNIGEELGTDGIEISVHRNPAPDHAPVQGKQFANEEFDKLQSGIEFEDSKGKSYDAIERHIGQYNCYHYIFAVLLGVSNPSYTDKQLKEINSDNKKGFKFEGEKYTKYEGEQLQRNIETTIRKEKDIQIVAKASGNKRLVGESQSKITQLTKEYRDLSKVSQLPTKIERLRVSGYRRVNVAKL